MEIRKLAAPDRPREYYRYKVSGSGAFPLDMLRYDSAWPVSSVAVERMSKRDLGEREVELASHRRPTDDRWSSFGWTVV